MTRTRQALLLVRPSLRTATLWPLLPAAACGAALVALDGGLASMRLAAAESAPAPLALRRGVRVALAAVAAGLLWPLVVASAGAPASGAVTLELAAMLAVTFAASAYASARVPDGRGGIAAIPALVVLLAGAALLLPDEATLFASGPGDPHWAASHVRWAGVLVLGAAALALCSRDPGRVPVRVRREPIAPARATDTA